MEGGTEGWMREVKVGRIPAKREAGGLWALVKSNARNREQGAIWDADKIWRCWVSLLASLLHIKHDSESNYRITSQSPSYGSVIYAPLCCETLMPELG